MSSQDRKKRRRLVVAAFTANGAGAVVGLAVHAAVADPVTSVLVGTIVSGTVGDVLLQFMGAPNDLQELDRSGELRRGRVELEDLGEGDDGAGQARDPGGLETSRTSRSATPCATPVPATGRICPGTGTRAALGPAARTSAPPRHRSS